MVGLRSRARFEFGSLGIRDAPGRELRRGSYGIRSPPMKLIICSPSDGIKYSTV